MTNKLNHLTKGIAAVFALLLLGIAVNAQNNTADSSVPPESEKGSGTPVATAEAQQPETQAVQTEVTERIDDKVGEEQERVLAEASRALDQTMIALRALDENKTEEALAALERVTGKLALIVARHPELTLAPVDSSVVMYDLYATPEAVQAEVEAAEEFLEDGAVQEARATLSALASEARIQTTHIPLGTYPAAIAAIAPLIDEGRIEEAKRDLALALNTLVVTEQVLPLPILRATALLNASEEMAEIKERTPEQNEELAGMLDAARQQVSLARALGYGDKKQFKSMLEEIDKIEKKTEGGKSGSGFFDAIKEKLDEF